MSAPLDPASPLARALAADRPRFNALFAAARAAQPGLEPAAFAALLAGTAAPVVAAVADAASARVAAAVDGLYPVLLDLLARGLLGAGARHPAVGEAWREVLPRVPHLVAADPVAAAAAVTNAAHALATTPAARPGDWVRRMGDLGRACPDLASFRDAGAVVAWECGMAHLRAGALAAAARLAAPLAARALGIPAVAGHAGDGVATALARLAADPWLDPAAAAGPPAAARELRVVALAGAFRGFGGVFVEPPTVRAPGGVLHAADREGAWRLHADRFGAVLRRAGDVLAGAPPGPPTPLRVARDGTVSFAGLAARFPECAAPSSFAADGATAAVTTRRTHAVVLVAAV